MNTRHSLVVLATAALLTLPLGAAEWTGRGFYEPDTARDVTSQGMFLNPDTDANPNVQQVYFSAFSAYYVATPNHNVGTIGSNIMVYPTNMHAVLGVWKDCNQDGYIGLPEGVAWDYLAVLLPPENACPAVVAGDHNATGFVPVHNDGTWVREFLPIGPDYETGGDDQGAEWQNNTNHYNIADEAARVWGDWGLPEDAAKASCPVNPRPTGTYQSTGGFLRYADCITTWRITGAFNTAAHAAGQDGLAFDDAPQERPDQSSSPLNQPNPYGQPDDQPVVSAYDCSADPAVELKDPTGGELPSTIEDPSGEVGDTELTDDEGNYAVVYGPRDAPVVNPDGSLAASVNETESGLNDCDMEEARNCGAFVFFGVDQHTGGDLYCLDEVPFEGTGVKRVQTDVYYNFNEGNPEGTAATTDDAPGCVVDAVPESCIPLEDEQMPYRGWPDDLGLAVEQTGFAAGTWFGSPGYVASRNPYVNRDDLSAWGAVYFTTYAYVSPTVGSLPGVAGTYGSDHCAGTTPITGAFQCDTEKWWLNADGSSLKTDWMVLPGQAYNLVDFDCYDASATKIAPASAVNTGQVGANQCLRP